MIGSTQREKALIIAVSIVAFVVVTFFIWKPLLAMWRQTSTEYASKQRQLELVKETLAKQPEIEKEFKELNSKMSNPNGVAPVSDVLQKVEQLARDSGITLRSRTPQPPRDKGGFTEVAVECSMDASIDSLVHFLYNVRTAQDLLDVTELKVTPKPANPSLLSADARLVSLRAGK